MALPIKITITTNPDLKQVALAYRKIREDDIADFFHKLAKILHKNIVEVAPERTGTGKKAIRIKRKGKFSWNIVLDRRYKGGGYMTAQHEGVPGAKINPILPLRPKYALWWPGLAHPVMSVTNHPGIPKNPFFDTGEAKARGDMEAAEKQMQAEIERKVES